MLVSPSSTTFYFKTKTTSPLCTFLGNKLQECVTGSNSCIAYTLLRFLASTASEIIYIQYHRKKAMKQKV